MDAASDASSSLLARVLRRACRAAVLVAGMGGLRLDRPAQLVRALPWIALAWVAARWMVGRGLGGAYVLASWALYYVGNTILLARPVRRRFQERLGGERAWAFYEAALGVMFFNQGLALAIAAAGAPGTLGLALAAAPARALAVGLFVVGFGCKLWATHLAGLDVYYYRDLFTERPTGTFVTSGPYRWLQNPMYGVGNVHSYAAALWALSGPGLAWAALFHASIYGFWLVVERPFVRRTYPAA